MSTPQLNRQATGTLGETDHITVLGIQTELHTDDVAVWAGIPFALFLVGVFMEIPLFILGPTVAFALISTTILVFSAPSYLSVLEFLKTIRYYLRNNGAVDNAATEVVSEDADESMLHSFKTADTTRDKTKVQRFYPEAGVLERDDGHYVGALRVSPPNRDFDSQSEFLKTAENIKERLNKNIDFGFQFYVTTRPFPIEEYVNELESRLGDADIQQKPIMEAILQEKIEKRPEDLEERGTEIPHYYLIVEAAPRQVEVQTSGTESPLQRLTGIPFLGVFFEIFAHIQSDVEQHQREAKLIDTVHNRLSRLNQAIVRPNEEYSSDVVSVTEWTELLHTFWTGRDQAAPVPREQPAVAGGPDVPQVSAAVNSWGSEGEADDTSDGGDVAATDDGGGDTEVDMGALFDDGEDGNADAGAEVNVDE